MLSSDFDLYPPLQLYIFYIFNSTIIFLQIRSKLFYNFSFIFLQLFFCMFFETCFFFRKKSTSFHLLFSNFLFTKFFLQSYIFFSSFMISFLCMFLKKFPVLRSLFYAYFLKIFQVFQIRLFLTNSFLKYFLCIHFSCMHIRL